MLESILSFFAFGTLGFWLLIVCLSIAYTIATEADEHGPAIFATIIGSLLLWKPLTVVVENWKLTLIVFAAYGIVGGVWSVFRWFKFCKKYISEYPFDGEDYSNREKFYTRHLDPAKHKSRLIGWIIYWPWSMIWNIAGDFFTGIYDALANIYNRVAATVIRKSLGKT